MVGFTTIAGIGLGVAGLASQRSANNRAAEAVETASSNSDATNLYIYEDIKDRNAYREGLGNEALGQIAGLYGLGGQTQGDGMNGTGFNGASNYNNMGRADVSMFGNQSNIPNITANGYGGFSQGGVQQPQYPTNAANQSQQSFQQPQSYQQAQGVNPAFQSFYESPDYQLAFNEGQQAIEGSAAARGGLLSGGTAKAITGYGQDLATSTFGNYRNSLNNIAGIGQQATNTISQAGQNYANSYGNNQMMAGQASANAAQYNGQLFGNALTGFGTGILGA